MLKIVLWMEFDEVGSSGGNLYLQIRLLLDFGMKKFGVYIWWLENFE
jgi:hypothetical protein